ncbi:MAG: hypothetical protein E6K53_05280 [Gammaproteobacteria bacterium]|nr:MAG: hypothetical protein E6K53_05280 [Gammaproteobacteria bacterium]
MLAALLWLPFAFFLWFAFAAQFAWPVVQIAKFVLLHGWPKLFLDVLPGADEISATGQLVAHRAFWMQINTNVVYNAAVAGQETRLAFYDFTLNPMIYGYSVPLFSGLVMATPLARWQRAAQIIGGVAILWLVQSFGVVAEAFKSTGIDLKEGAAAMHQFGYSLDAIALAYQFGYLILPPLVPAVLWIVLNRAFIEELTRPVAAEPKQGAVVEEQHGNL